MMLKHKLFSGTECLNNRNINVNFQEFHRDDKLRRTHSLPPQDGGLPAPAGFDIRNSPYVRELFDHDVIQLRQKYNESMAGKEFNRNLII